jgi:phosphoribosylformimino-5-aminoimidazole carboxamide ribonucleotide (ProFAR) isomerase
MALISGPSRTSPSMSIDEAITKIRTAVEVINLRGGIRDHEEKRVEEAFAMLAQPQGLSSGKKSGKTSKRRENYLHFLRRVDEQCGSQLVVASSVGIGQAAIAGMKELTRLRLPLEIKKHERALKSPNLQKVVNKFCIKG